MFELIYFAVVLVVIAGSCVAERAMGRARR